jgi:hypothetical protein
MIIMISTIISKCAYHDKHDKHDNHDYYDYQSLSSLRPIERSLEIVDRRCRLTA